MKSLSLFWSLSAVEKSAVIGGWLLGCCIKENCDWRLFARLPDNLPPADGKKTVALLGMLGSQMDKNHLANLVLKLIEFLCLEGP